MDTRIFFPARGEPCAAAQAVCGSCPVARECLEYGVETDSLGIWGGTSERKRAMIRREERAGRVA